MASNGLGNFLKEEKSWVAVQTRTFTRSSEFPFANLEGLLMILDIARYDDKYLDPNNRSDPERSRVTGEFSLRNCSKRLLAGSQHSSLSNDRRTGANAIFDSKIQANPPNIEPRLSSTIS